VAETLEAACGPRALSADGRIMDAGCGLALAASLVHCPRPAGCLSRMGDDPPSLSTLTYTRRPDGTRYDLPVNFQGTPGVAEVWPLYEICAAFSDDRLPFEDLGSSCVQVYPGEISQVITVTDCGGNTPAFRLQGPPVELFWAPLTADSPLAKDLTLFGEVMPLELERGQEMVANAFTVRFNTGGGPITGEASYHTRVFWPACSQWAEYRARFELSGTYNPSGSVIQGAVRAFHAGTGYDTGCWLFREAEYEWASGQWAATFDGREFLADIYLQRPGTQTWLHAAAAEAGAP
jgi:hypothetical protein